MRPRQPFAASRRRPRGTRRAAAAPRGRATTAATLSLALLLAAVAVTATCCRGATPHPEQPERPGGESVNPASSGAGTEREAPDDRSARPGPDGVDAGGTDANSSTADTADHGDGEASWFDIAPEPDGSQEADEPEAAEEWSAVEPLPAAIPWPLAPRTSAHPLGNRHGQYFKPDDWPEAIVHQGVDVLGAAGARVYAVHDGYVTYLRANGEPNTGLVIGRPGDAGEGLAYWHLTEIVPARDAFVKAGEEIGRVARWPDDAAFAHVHLERAQGTAAPGTRLWNKWSTLPSSLGNLQPHGDDQPPKLPDFPQSLRFQSDDGDELHRHELSGRVDIVVKTRDRASAGTGHWLVPHRFELGLRRHGDAAVVDSGVPALDLDGLVTDAELVADVLYSSKSAATLATDRRFLVVITNTDGDGTFDAADAKGAWDTTGFENGEYELIVKVSDLAGNATSRVVGVTIKN